MVEQQKPSAEVREPVEAQTQTPEATSPEKTEAPLSPGKKRALLEYLGIMFAVAFLLVAISLGVKLHTMQDDFNAANQGARENIEAMESQLEQARVEREALTAERDALQQSVRATELLTLAQNAYGKHQTAEFRCYMTELAPLADTLPEEAAAIYERLYAYMPKQ